MLIVNAAISATQHADIRLEHGRIGAVAPTLASQNGEQVIDAQGNALIPGLHDHHMHLLALASAEQSLDCNVDDGTLAQKLVARCRETPTEIRGINYHPGENNTIDLLWLDQLCPDIPVRIQHQSGRLWILNSAAIRQINTGIDNFPAGAERDAHGALTGRFYHVDDWLRAHLPRTTPALGSISRQLASYGVTGLTDAGPDNDDSVARLLLDAQARGELLQNVLLMGRAELADIAGPTLKRGPRKLYLKETDLPEFDVLCDAIRDSHNENRPVAFHCVTRVEMQFALSALREAGTHRGDRIEHASVTSDDALEQCAKLGITAVTQPHFIAERGDRYRAQVESEDQPFLYRAQSFLRAGIALAAGTDAPYGNHDPWRSMRAAVERCSQSGHLMGADERLQPEQALALYLGDCEDPGRKRRSLAAGQPADLCLLDTDWATMLTNLNSKHIRQVWCGGRIIFSREIMPPPI